MSDTAVNLPKDYTWDEPDLPDGYAWDEPIDVDRSPIDLPPAQPEQTFGVEGGIIPPFTVAPDQYTQYDREAASRGVDIFNELEDKDLRSAISFSAGKPFTVEYLSRNIAEKTGLPQDQVVQIAPGGEIEFYNPETKRFTPVDGRNVTMADLKDLYGPTAAIAPPIIGAVGGFAIGGFWGSAGFGASGAFLGEVARLNHGRNLGVHDLSDEDILWEGAKAFGLDAAFAGGGYATASLYKVGKRLLKAEAISKKEAQDILDEMGKYKDDIDVINDSLEEATRAQRFKLDPVADAESVVGLELRSSAESGLGGAGKQQRVTEIKANESALEEYAKVINRLDLPEGQIFTNEGADAAARPAQQELRQIQSEIQTRYDSNLLAAEYDAYRALEEIGDVSMGAAKSAGGARARAVVVAHADELRSIKDRNYEAYMQSIGQKRQGSFGWKEGDRWKSSVQVPIDKSYVDFQKAAKQLRKDGILTSKAQGEDALKLKKAGDTVDLAVLDENIKQLREILRNSDGSFSVRRVQLAEKQLTKLRNDYLAKNNPQAYGLLTKAEDSMTTYKDFTDKSVLNKVLAQTPSGTYRVDDVAVFKQVFIADDGGKAMRALVEVANKQPGAIFGLQDAVLKFYRNSVVPAGGKIMTRAKHDVFVERYADQLDAVFPAGPVGTPQLQKFGQFEASVAYQKEKAKNIAKMLKRSELWKLSNGRPERMGQITFGGNISNKQVRRTMLALQQNPAALTSYRDSVGREVYHRITSEGALNDAALINLLENDAAKLTLIFGERYVPQMKTLARLINANRLTVPGKQIAQDTLIGRAARALISPPLTRRGRAQTFIEKLRTDAAHKMVAAAVRDEKILQSIVANANNDIRNQRVMTILGQIGAAELMYDDTLE